MAQRIVTLCDVHARNEEDEAGATWSVTLTAPGEAPTSWEIDLCQDDSKTLSDLAVMLDAVGRVTKGPRRKVATAARKAARTAGEGITAPRPVSENHRPVEAPHTDAGYPCPVEGCGKVPSTRQSLMSHLRAAHDGLTLAAATGQPTPYACPAPGCDFKSARPQGLGAHRKAAHGTASQQRAEG